MIDKEIWETLSADKRKQLEKIYMENNIPSIKERKRLRDEFAMAALPSLVPMGDVQGGAPWVAVVAYSIADAMLEAREK